MHHVHLTEHILRYCWRYLPGYLAFAAVTLALIATPATAEVISKLTLSDRQWQIAVLDVNDDKRAKELVTWINPIIQAALNQPGQLPLSQARIEIREIQSKSDSAVPWGQTVREKPAVRLLLFVRKNTSLVELTGDWTAPHELAHLSHPYLGRSGRWLAEGYASYQQYRIMARAGVLDANSAWQRLHAGLVRGELGTEANSTALAQTRGTMRVYWAGAAFWLEVDLRLRKSHLSLDQLMARYTQCCMRGEFDGIAPEAFAQELDRVVGRLSQSKNSKLPNQFIAKLFAQYAQAVRFPDLRASYQQLGLRRVGDGVVFDDDPGKTKLRKAIMLQR